MHLTVTGKRTRLHKLKAGSLFRYNGDIFVKTPYITDTAYKCYSITTGEIFLPVKKNLINHLLVNQIHLHT